VKISIGPDKKIYTVHKDLICHYSEYFRTAYNGRWKEAEGGVALDDVEPEVFNIFIHWLYAQTLPKGVTGLFGIAGIVDSDSHKRITINHFLSVKSYVFGDRFMALNFKRIARNHHIDLKSESAPWYKHAIYAFANLQGDDPFLAYLVDMHCICWYPEVDETDEVETRAELPNLFLVRVMLRSHELKDIPATKLKRDLNLCTSYHDHESDKERQECPSYKSEQKKKEDATARAT
jgi:hypothetical protein